MNYKKSILLLLISFILILSPNTIFASNEEKLDDFVGTYRGSYYANQGHTGLTLKVYLDESSNYKAKFNFYSVPENPSVPSGEYTCDVEYNKSKDEYVIIGKEWIKKPTSYVFVDLYGKYENLSYKGDVKSTLGASGKHKFDLVKQVEENQPSIWAEETVDSAVLDGIVPLELQGNYVDPITRSEFTRIMIATISKYQDKDIEKILKEKNIKLNKNIFDDTKDQFVLAAYELGIIEGYGNSKFGPDDLLTREQAAKILRNMLDFFGEFNTNKSGMKFQDENNFSSWAKEDVKFITSCYVKKLDTSIMEGIGLKFDPKGKYTKEQSYLTVYRLLKYIE